MSQQRATINDFELLSQPSSPHSCWSTPSNSSETRAGDVQGTEVTYTISSGTEEQMAQNQQQPVLVKPKLTMRHINTPINLLVCGASSTGKSSFIRACTRLLNPNRSAAAGAAEVSGSGRFSDPHAVLLDGPEAFVTLLDPILVPEAGRALVYKFQDCPGHGSTLDPAGYLEALLTFLLRQQEKDYKQLCGSRGMHKSLACGCLQHSITACIYFLPPHGPTAMDIVVMSGLSKRVGLLPVVGKADVMTDEEAAGCCEAVRNMLAQPQEYVASELGAMETFRFSAAADPSGTLLPLLLHTHDPKAATASADLSKLLELLTGDEVYGLLDNAWEAYTSFCTEYEKAGNCLQQLIIQAQKDAVSPHLPSRTETQDLKQELQKLQVEMSAQLGKLTFNLDYEQAQKNQAQAKAKEAEERLGKEAKLLDELWDLFKTYKLGVGQSSYAVSRYTSSKKISAELKSRLPDLT